MENNNGYVIETRGLSHSFGHLTAVKNLSFAVSRRSIYGFLGPNGAGKTTTIRILLGLIQPDDGEVRLFGLPLSGNQRAVFRQVGSLIESPSLYPHLTGRENLEVIRRLLAVPRKHIDRVLAIVRLERDAGRVVHGYSLGMRQRLGLAVALLGEPELLILDEPTNGLDPAGIHEMRALLKSLPGEYGVTVFLSSHLLSEIEQMATHIGIIESGRLLFQGTLSELQEQRREHLIVKVSNADEAMKILEKGGWSAVKSEDSRIVVSVNTSAEAAKINETLVRSGFDVSHLSLERLSLEEIFLNLTNESRIGKQSGK